MRPYEKAGCRRGELELRSLFQEASVSVAVETLYQNDASAAMALSKPVVIDALLSILV